MRRTFLLTAALSVVLAAASVTPALAQLAGDAPLPPEFQVEEDGTLVIGGDVRVPCSEFGLGVIDTAEPNDPAVRACEAAGFPTAVSVTSGRASAPSSTSASTGASAPAAAASALPETGGPASFMALVPLVLLVGTGLLAFRLVRRDF